MQEVRKVIRSSVLPYTPSGAGATAPADAVAKAAPPGDSTATPSVDTQGDVCMATGDEDSSMNGNATAAPGAPVDTVAAGANQVNGKVSGPGSADAVEEDSPMQDVGSGGLEGAAAELRKNGADNGTAEGNAHTEDPTTAVKLSAAPPQIKAEASTDLTVAVKPEGVATGTQLQEEDFRALQQQARTLQVRIPPLLSLFTPSRVHASRNTRSVWYLYLWVCRLRNVA